MTATTIESSVLVNISEQILVLPSGDMLPMTTPELRRSSGKYLTLRGLRLTNAIIRKGILQVAGSPWLPGFWNLSAGKAEVALQAFKAQGAACTLFLSFTDSPVNSKGWHSYKGDPYMVLPVSWSSFDEYVASMKKKYRARVRKVQKSNQGLRIEILPQEGPQFEQCVTMLEATLRDKVVALPGNLEHLLGMFKRCFGASFKIYGFYLDHELVGFITCIEDGPILRAMHIGFSENAPEYFYSYAMFTLIGHGITTGVQKVHLGRTGTEIKSTYGAVSEDNYFSFYSSSRFFQLLMRFADRYYRPKTYSLRSPFGTLSKKVPSIR